MNLSPKRQFISSLKTNILHPALTSHYICDIQIPGSDEFIKFAEANRVSNVRELLTLSCCEASLPGSSIATHDLNNDFTGVTQRHAYRRLYDDRADFTFYVNNTYTQIRFFEMWMRFISGEQITGSDSPTSYYRVRYPIKYKSAKIAITKFERDAQAELLTQSGLTKFDPRKIEYTFINAFPSNINSMPVSYDGGQLLKCTVSFIYDRYISGNDSEAPSPTSFIPARKSSALNSPNQPQPSIPADVAQNPYLQSQFNINQLSNLGDYSNTFANINGPLF
jgi:hypothetical protein